MKNGVLILVIVFAMSATMGCRKQLAIDYQSDDNAVGVARQIFDSVSRQKADPQLSVTSQKRSLSPRKTLSRAADWSRAKITALTKFTVVTVPLRFSNPMSIQINLAKNRAYSLDNLSRVVIYTDEHKKFHVEQVMYLPDSNYLPGSKSFSGIILVEDWNGNQVAEYICAKNESVSKLDGRANHRNVNPAATNNAQKIIEVCYEMSGYNYAVNDPDGGYYWSESLGCNSYFLPDSPAGGGVGPSGADYGNLGGGGAGGFGGDPITALPINFAYSLDAGGVAISNMAEYVKCFDNVPGADHQYKVTVCVEQPIPGSRETWGFAGTSSSGTGNPVGVGHVFVVMTENKWSGSIIRNFGFYPTQRVHPISPSAPGQVFNDAYTDYNISLTTTIDNAQFFNILNYLSRGNDANSTYDLNINNCATFAIRALAQGSVFLPQTRGTWLNGAGYNPGDLGEDIRNMQLGNNMVRSIINSEHLNVGVCY